MATAGEGGAGAGTGVAAWRCAGERRRADGLPHEPQGRPAVRRTKGPTRQRGVAVARQRRCGGWTHAAARYRCALIQQQRPKPRYSVEHGAAGGTYGSVARTARTERIVGSAMSSTNCSVCAAVTLLPSVRSELLPL